MKIPSYLSFTVLFLCHSKLPSLNIHLETNYIMIQNTKSKYDVEWGSWEEATWLQAQWKETSLLNFHTPNYWAGLFKSIFLYELYMAIITELHSRGKKKKHSKTQHFKWQLTDMLSNGKNPFISSNL